ncbi:hypothetical protein [Maridesulfovibrio hydrothermalis]|uniref:Uncharacterized protein n=1 Tax=Maridesulfovibrio hydrothermalis AM13 = DSM 14728 TaxID=1121451 RepID=L0R9J0_9BACT|nr:hypothetical protein [Maridesulfovibrio hydrothermalis]CCO22887.1 conserved exported protein of unknown function [Maridesulfovibrio hydrothermalis AM13 = DSM 14728]
MKVRLILITLFILIVTALPALAQDDCPSIFKAELENLPGIKSVVQDQNGFLAILDSAEKIEATRKVSSIKALRKKTNPGQCDFSGVAVAIMDSNLQLVKSSTDSALNRDDVTKLLYKYVYDLSPVEVEENLKGYERLSERSPQNSYYAARKKHYIKRINLIKARNEFIAQCLKEARKDKSIVDLKVKKDFYLFVTATENAAETAAAFLEKVVATTQKPEKKLCVIAYSKDLSSKETNCPDEYKKNLVETEEELLMRHVQSLPSYQIQRNINGYKALKALNPNSTLYTRKLAAYEIKLQGLNKFLNISFVNGNRVFTKSSSKGSTLFASVNKEALKGKSQSAKLKLFKTLAAYYAHTGKAYPRCVLKNSAGKTLGTISCGKTRCSFR